MSKKRRTFSAKQKAKIALAAIQERLPNGAIASQYEVHPNQVSVWKKQALDGMESIFTDGRKAEDPTTAHRLGKVSVNTGSFTTTNGPTPISMGIFPPIFFSGK